MKRKHLFKLFIFVLLMLFMASCATGGAPGYSGGDSSYGEEIGSTGSGKGDSESGVPVMPDDVVPPGDDDNPNDYVPEPGQITACAYNDNDHYEFWLGLKQAQGEGVSFYNYHNEFAFKTANRIHLTLPKDVSTQVNLLNQNNEIIYSSYSDKMGNCYLYPQEQSNEYKIELVYTNSDNTIVKEIRTITGDATIEYSGLNTSSNVIQLMFVIDATGSMGDEMAYLKSEVNDIIEKIKEAYSDIIFELAILMYRDYGDSYVTKYSGFTSDIKEQLIFLNDQRAQGGGDFEEAVHTALKEANTDQWRENATKILIHIADAPSHDNDVADWYNSTLDLASKGVRIITVASSGIDKKTEYFFRSQSMITNGHYVYITNDSGIGGYHIEATVEEKPTVEYLNSCLIRLIKGYHTGVFEEAIYYKQQQ